MADPRAVDPQLLRKVEELGRALAESEPVQAFHRAVKALDEHQAARIMLEDLLRQQRAIEAKRRAGQEIIQDEVEHLQRSFELAMYNPYVRDVFEAQAAVLQVLDAIFHHLTEAAGLAALGELAEGEAVAERPEATTAPAGSAAAGQAGQPAAASGAAGGSGSGAGSAGQGPQRITPVRSKLWVPPGAR